MSHAKRERDVCLWKYLWQLSRLSTSSGTILHRITKPIHIISRNATQKSDCSETFNGQLYSAVQFILNIWVRDLGI